MFTNQVFTFMNKYVGDYLYGFNSDQLKVGLLNGSIKMKNLTVKPDKVNEHLIFIRSPILLKAGILGGLRIDLNYFDWTKTDLVIDDLLLVLGPNFHELKQSKDYTQNDERFITLGKKLGEYEKFNGDILQQEQMNENLLRNMYDEDKAISNMLKQKAGPTMSMPFSGVNDPDATPKKTDIFKSIIGADWLKFNKVLINNIHIRYEDDQLTYTHPISLGILIKSIMLTPNSQITAPIPISEDTSSFNYYYHEKKFIDTFLNDTLKRRDTTSVSQQLLINNFEIYINSASEMYVPFSLYQATMKSPHGIFEAMPPMELKALMLQYLDKGQHFKYPTIQIERIELQALIAMRNETATTYKNFAVLNFNTMNMNIAMKPDTLSDILDLKQYLYNFKIWQVLEELKPAIRPITNPKWLQSQNPAVTKLRRIINREWWHSILWYNRLKKAVREKRIDLIPVLHSEYKRTSLLKILENFNMRDAQKGPRNYKYPTIDPRNEYQQRYNLYLKQSGNQVLMQALKRMNLAVIVFMNVKDIAFRLQENAGKTMLQHKIENIHLNTFRNVDFEGGIGFIFHMHGFRIYGYRPEGSRAGVNSTPARLNKVESTSTMLNGSIYPTNYTTTNGMLSTKSVPSIFGANRKMFEQPMPVNSRVQTSQTPSRTREELPYTGRVPTLEDKSFLDNNPAIRGMPSNNPKAGKIFGGVNTVKALDDRGGPVQPHSAQKQSMFPQEKLSYTPYNESEYNSRISIFNAKENTNSNVGQQQQRSTIFPGNSNNAKRNIGVLNESNNFAEVHSIGGMSSPVFGNPYSTTHSILHQSIVQSIYVPQQQQQQQQPQAQQPLQKSTLYSNEVVLMELYPDFVVKLNGKMDRPHNSDYHLKTEVSEVKVIMESEVLKDLLEYSKEYRKLFHLRHLNWKSLWQSNMNIFKKSVKRRVFTFAGGSKTQMEDGASTQMNQQKFINILQANQVVNNMVRKVEHDVLEKDPFVAEDVKDQGEVDFTALFLKKCSDFIAAHEINVNINLDVMSFSLHDSSISAEPLLCVKLPKGRIHVALNAHKKNINIIEVFGFRVETASKLQALYFLFKKLKALAKLGVSGDIDKNVKFLEMLQGPDKNTQESQNFIRMYSSKRFTHGYA
jgi:hypothetical protein